MLFEFEIQSCRLCSSNAENLGGGSGYVSTSKVVQRDKEAFDFTASYIIIFNLDDSFKSSAI